MTIHVVGYGIQPANDLTLLGLNTLKSSDKVLMIGPESDASALISLGVDLENIFSLYGNGRADVENYQAICSKILKDASQYASVALAVPGNPGVGVTVVQTLIAERQQHGHELNLVAGISSFDWMLLENFRDPLERGTCILDANRLLLFDFPINPAIDHYIYHVCSVGTKKAWIREPGRDNQIYLLQEKLLQAFPSSHPVYLVSANGAAIISVEQSECPNRKSVLASCTVGDIKQILGQVTFDSTLYIPAANPKHINREFLALLQSS